MPIYLYSIQAHLIHNINHHLGCNVRNQLVFSISTGSPYFVVINSIVPKTFWASYHDLIKRSFGILRQTISAGELFQCDHNVMEVLKSEDLGWQEPGRKKTVLRGGGFHIKTRRDRFFDKVPDSRCYSWKRAADIMGGRCWSSPLEREGLSVGVEGNSASVVVVFVLVCLCLSLFVFVFSLVLVLVLLLLDSCSVWLFFLFLFSLLLKFVNVCRCLGFKGFLAKLLLVVISFRKE